MIPQKELIEQILPKCFRPRASYSELLSYIRISHLREEWDSINAVDLEIDDR